MRSTLAYLTIVLFWGVIYLPALGDREIRGEEWRRTLPARTMLNTGEWIVTYSGGLPYFKKPPLINWVSAASFELTGVQNEWTARLPSALLMLGAAIGIHVLMKRAVGGTAAFLGTIFFLTSLGVVEKGRIAEIEVYYITLTGLAFAAWLAGFMGKMNRWLSWLSAGFFLGLAFLAKGPMHLLFFGAIVLGASWGRRRFLDGPMFAGLALCLAMVMAWGIPFAGKYEHLSATQPWLFQVAEKGAEVTKPDPPRTIFEKWWHEVASRVTGEEESSTKDWLVRGPRALTMFLPWVLFVPLWWRKKPFQAAFGDDEQTARTFRGIAWGIVASFAFMVLIPSSSPRYTAPLLAPVALMSGWLLAALAESAALANKIWRWTAMGVAVLGILTLISFSFISFVPPGPDFPPPWQALILLAGAVVGIMGAVWWRHEGPAGEAMRNCFLTLAACAVVMTAYSWIGPWASGRDEKVRPVGGAISDAMEPKDAPLYVFHLGQQPYAFYLPKDSIELYSMQQLPDQGVRWMLTSRKVHEDFRAWFERRYGTATKLGEWTGVWGESDQDVNRNMVLLRFAGK